LKHAISPPDYAITLCIEPCHTLILFIDIDDTLLPLLPLPLIADIIGHYIILIITPLIERHYAINYYDIITPFIMIDID
jgi:hypothetical protein